MNENSEKLISIKVRGKIAELTNINFELVGGNSDYKIHFDFDSDWKKQNVKTAIFVFGGDTRFRVFSGNVCDGVSVQNANTLFIGVISGDIITTTPATVCGIKQSITDIGGVPKAPETNTYNQIIALLNKIIEQGKGLDGLTPYIKDGNWWIGEEDTGVRAEGVDGKNGSTPYIQDNYWYIDGINTQIIAKGQDGKDGLTPYIKDSYWHIGDKNTGVIARGKDGNDGNDGVGIEKIEFANSDGIKDTYTIILTNGKTANFTVTNGKDGRDGENGQDGKNGLDGKDGADGYTPKKGVDYWTPEDIADIKAYVDEAILGGEW